MIDKKHIGSSFDSFLEEEDMILDPENTSITLNTIEKVAKYLGKRIVLSFA